MFHLGGKTIPQEQARVLRGKIREKEKLKFFVELWNEAWKRSCKEEWTIVRTRRSKARSHQRRVHSPSFCPALSSSSTPSDATAASSNGLNSSGNGTTKKMVRNRDGEGERRKMEEEEQKLLLFKVQRSMEKVQHSAFFTKFMEQLQD